MTYTEFMVKSLIITVLKNNSKKITTDDFVIQVIDKNNSKVKDIDILKDDLASSLNHILNDTELLQGVKTLIISFRDKTNHIIELTSIEIN